MSVDASIQKIVAAVAALIPEPVYSNIVFVTIVTVQPLKVRMDDTGTELPETFFWVNKFLLSGEVMEFMHHHAGAHGPTSYNPALADHAVLKLADPLKPGDKVMMISLNNNQMYYIAERI